MKHAYMHFNTSSQEFQPVFFFSGYNKANGSTALKTGPHWLDKDGNLSVVFNSLNSVFSLSLISSFKQTSSIRFFSPSVNSVLFASSSWMKTVHIIGNPLVCLSRTSGEQSLELFFGLEKIKEFLFARQSVIARIKCMKLISSQKETYVILPQQLTRKAESLMMLQWITIFNSQQHILWA